MKTFNVKLLTKLFLFLFTLTLLNCEKETVDIKTEAQQEKKLSRISFNRFKNMVSAKSLIKFEEAFSPNTPNERTSSSSDPKVIMDDIVKVQFDDFATYTFKVIAETEADEFYNLVLHINDQQEVTKSNILKYTPSESWLLDPTQYFSGNVAIMDNNFFDVSSLTDVLRNDSCVTGVSTGWECHYGNNHYPGGTGVNKCNGPIFEYTFVIEIETGPCSGSPNDGGNIDPLGGLPNNPGGPSGGGSPDGNNINTSPNVLGDIDIFLANANAVASGLGIQPPDLEYAWLTNYNNNKDKVYEIVDYANEVGINEESISIILDYINIALRIDSAGFERYLELIEILEVDPTISYKEKRLTLETLLDENGWIENPGNFNNISSLAYTHTRDIVVNLTPLKQFKLVNGDRLSLGNYNLCSGCSEGEDRVYYFSKQYNLWYEIPNPSTYTPTNLDFLWNGFWNTIHAGARYCTPLEDVVILIGGKDFDGVEQSRAVAGGFILVEIIPGAAAVKLIKVLKYGDEIIDIAAAAIRYVDDAYKTQKQAIENVLGDVDWFELDLFDNTIRKGNFGEMVTDTDLYGKGYEVLHNRVQDIDQALNQGIDGIFRNPDTGEFLVVETKFGQSNLNPTTATGPQMSQSWINTRLDGEVGIELGEEILDNGYTSILAKVLQNGDVAYFELDNLGEIIGPWLP